MKKISLERIASLNSGEEETKNLMEFLSIDFQILLANSFPEFIYPNFESKLGVVEK